ncbi:MAG: ammonium transporter [Magnetococcales bacterium]|nr:ammonium transporter [Magnetococcales bacterium]MBF0347672.1 ammonium transporter [Magnetococcales bacterium]MBF0631248.1 ammonium transporter [Magnetococcales bacterium]
MINLKDRRRFMLAALPVLFSPGLAHAENVLNSGDTAWMLTSTALVLFMTIPGLSLFYAGMVRTKNVLSVLMQCFAITALMTIIWTIYGYSLSFTDGGGLNDWIGGMENLFLMGIGVDSLRGTIPTTVFVIFQMTFAIITPALIVGAFAERMKFSSMLVFLTLWITIVYAPVCHWAWGGGWMGAKGVLDFAGGTVVHINAGIAGLVAALVLGKRKGYPTMHMAPHNLPLTVTGAGMLWVGWFGFNAGSELAADGTAGMAMAVTQIATATAAFVWMLMEWMRHGKPSALGIVTGAVGGLVAITPASGYVGPIGALAIGGAAGIFCFLGATTLKRRMGYDDSLDAFGVHGIGGIIGAILTGVFAAKEFGGKGFASGIETMGHQLTVQIFGVLATTVYCALATFIILKIVGAIMGLRVDDEQETMGLDISLHDERGYNL